MVRRLHILSKSLLITIVLSLISYTTSAQNRQGHDVSVDNNILLTDTTFIQVGSVDSSFLAVDTLAFCPDPTKAVWYSALCPGLGQIYNRSYWKLPIIIGGYLALIYATNWNNRYYTDYSIAYRDAMDNDPYTDSYINFLSYNRRNDPEWINANMSWLQSTMKKKKDYYRKYRDLCVISMIGVYFVAMIEAYVDAHLYNFDISDNLSMKVSPTVIEPNRNSMATIGFQCAITF